MSTNGSIEVTVSRLDPSGDGLAIDDEGRRHVIPGLLPGETALVRVRRRDRSKFRSQVVELVETSPARVAAPCEAYRSGCGGCQLQHLALADQRRLKVELVRERFTAADVAAPDEIDVVELDPWMFRTSLRVAVDRAGVAGFHRRRTHQIVGAAGCEIAHPLLTELLRVGRFAGADEVTLRCGARTGERLAAPAPQIDLVGLPDDVRSDYLHEFAVDRRWRVSADAFFQSRPDAVDALGALVAAAASEVSGPKEAVDLYSGVGIFAGVLVDQGWSVTAVESAGPSVADARANLHDDPVTIVEADVGRWRPRPATLVVADPNRIGVGPDGAAVIAATGATRVVLISCDVSGLVNDSRLLQRAGYRRSRTTLVDVFPHTFHIEMVSVFDRT
jgi:23S rRNA (uracil1939-C5)-methyltransferase